MKVLCFPEKKPAPDERAQISALMKTLRSAIDELDTNMSVAAALGCLECLKYEILKNNYEE